MRSEAHESRIYLRSVCCLLDTYDYIKKLNDFENEISSNGAKYSEQNKRMIRGYAFLQIGERLNFIFAHKPHVLNMNVVYSKRKKRLDPKDKKSPLFSSFIELRNDLAHSEGIIKDNLLEAYSKCLVKHKLEYLVDKSIYEFKFDKKTLFYCHDDFGRDIISDLNTYKVDISKKYGNDPNVFKNTALENFACNIDSNEIEKVPVNSRHRS